MLHFVDQSKLVQVFRVGDGALTPKRTKLGHLLKPHLEIPDSLKSDLENDELRELDLVVETYHLAEKIESQLAAVKFPQYVRGATDYISSGQASEVEKKLILDALRDGIARIRRSDAQAHEQKDPA